MRGFGYFGRLAVIGDNQPDMVLQRAGLDKVGKPRHGARHRRLAPEGGDGNGQLRGAPDRVSGLPPGITQNPCLQRLEGKEHDSRILIAKMPREHRTQIKPHRVLPRQGDNLVQPLPGLMRKGQKHAKLELPLAFQGQMQGFKPAILPPFADIEQIEPGVEPNPVLFGEPDFPARLRHGRLALQAQVQVAFGADPLFRPHQALQRSEMGGCLPGLFYHSINLSRGPDPIVGPSLRQGPGTLNS